MTARRLGRSFVSAAGAELWQVVSRVLLTPLILARIGLEGYGVWSLLFSLCGYVSVVHTSFSLAYTKYAAEHDVRQDYRGLARILASGMLLVGTVGFVGFGALWLARNPILSFLKVPEHLLEESGQAFLIVALCVLLRMSVGCVFDVLAGLQRMDLRYNMIVLASILEFCSAFFFISRGWGLLGLAISHLLGQVTCIVAGWVICLVICPSLKLRHFRPSSQALRQVFSLGGRFQLLYLIALINAEGFKMVISALLGVSTLAVFEIARKVLLLGDAVGGALVAPLMPAFANVHAGGQGQKAESLLSSGSKVLSIISILSFGFLALFADRLIFLWTARELPEAAWTIRIMAGAYILKHLTGVATASLRGQGSVGLEIGFAVVNACVWLPTVAPLYHWWGYRGLVIAAAASLLVGASWFLFMFSRRRSFSLSTFLWRNLFRPGLVLAPLLASAALLRAFVDFPVPPLPGRWGVLVDLLLWSSVLGLSGMVLCWRAALTPSERNALAKAFARTKAQVGNERVGVQ